MKISLIDHAISKRVKQTLAIGAALMLAMSPMLAAPARADTFPEVISLPNGFYPEGIDIGKGTTMWVGSLANGAIYKADLRTGKGEILVQPQPGRLAAGIKFDPRTNYLYVAGAFNGHTYVYDATTGADVADFLMTPLTSTVTNDIAITRDAVYITDSVRPVFYRIPLKAGGRLPDASAIQEIPLSGDFEFLPEGFNSNGIVATPDGKWLIIVHIDLGRLYRVDPISGQATQIDLGVPRVGKDGSDGLVLVGRTLYNINFYNEVIPIELNRDLTKGVIMPSITSPTFGGPTTAARFGSWLYVVNGQLDVAPTPETPYTVSRVKLK